MDTIESSINQAKIDYTFKILLVGDSGVGKSSILLRFTSDIFDDRPQTVAGQEKFRTLTASYYRSAHGIILVYDVTNRETFINLSDVWLKEVDIYSTNQDCIKMLVGNKVDRESERIVSKDEGMEFARQYGCLFVECSAKDRVNVEQCFEELVLKILETPSLLEETSSEEKKNIFDKEQPKVEHNGSCC